MLALSDVKLGIIGLGYVGLPLAVEFGKYRDVLGFDLNSVRIKELNAGYDRTLEVEEQNLKKAHRLSYTDNLKKLNKCNFYIVTVPTPVDEFNKPDLTPLINASRMLGEVISVGDVVVFESTVYPGATEEVCIPEIEKQSGLKFNQDFFVGYSPERINPGDKVNTLTTIKKIVSGSTQETLDLVDELYGSIITAGTHRAMSLKVAEAAKVIENTQRDLNIAVINEFSKIFNILDIDTQAVLDAAGSKWNFLKFKPGLVGGHCISVDPYYLTFKAQEVGYSPEVILAGRRINDGMGQYVATQMVKKLASKKIHIDEARVLILGITFKGDCPDIRNTKIVDIVKELKSFNIMVDVCDSWANPEEVLQEYSIKLIENPELHSYDGVIIAVDHSEYADKGIDMIRNYTKENSVIYDVKHVFEYGQSDLRL